MEKLVKKIWIGMTKIFAAIHWDRTQAVINGGIYYRLKEADHDRIRELLSKNYMIIFTRRNSHLTTYLIALASFFVRRRFAHYTHVLMNVEGDLQGHIGYKLLEATGVGVHYSTFMQVFDCDSVALLAPKGVTPEEWTRVMDYAKAQFGKGYDNFFDIASDEYLSCIELIYWGLRELPNFETRFPKLLALISEPTGNITPQDLYDTGELEVWFETRR